MTPDVSDEVKEGYDLLEGIGIVERTESGQYCPTEVGAAIIYVVAVQADAWCGCG